MIYDFPAGDVPVRQGDIFIGMPRVDLSLRHMPVITADSVPVDLAWEEFVEQGSPATALLAIKPVTAIVASQDCDAARAPDITLCEIDQFRKVEGKSKDTTSTRSWVSIITQQARLNQKWFYLPPDARIGFGNRMGVDFHMTIRVPRIELVERVHLRRGRLNTVALAHFRERLAEFFRRYAYDEWYPLSPEEMKEYRKNYPDAAPYPWQIASRIGQDQA